MTDDSSQDQTQTIQDTNQQPVIPTEQSPGETPPEQQPTAEQSANPVPSDTQTTQTAPIPPTSPSPEPQPAETPQQTQPETPVPTETPPQPEHTPLVSPPAVNIPALHYPFSGNIPVTFAFGSQSDNEDIKKKFSEWGIVGHNGLDFGLTTGTEVFPCDSGKVIQSGDSGDFGASITIQHSWGQSLYAHLSETKVKVDEEIQPNKVIGLSGSSGAAFGEHLHFAIKPNNPNSNNGYLGFIDPAPYLSLPSQKEEAQEVPKQEEETPPIQTTPTEEQKTQEDTKSSENTQSQQEQPKPEETQPKSETPLPINYGPEIPAEPTQSQPAENPQQSEESQTTQMPQSSDEEIQKQVDEKLKVELDARRLKANEVRAKKKEENLTKIFSLVQNKGIVTNDEVRDFLRVSQSTATNYLTEMVNRGMLKKEGERGGAKYSI